MILYGAGGHAKVVIDCLKANRIDCKGLFDDNPQSLYTYGKYKILGNYQTSVLPEELLLICVGDNYARLHISKKINHRFARLVHPNACVSPTNQLAEGCQVMAMAVLQAKSVLQQHVIVNTGAIVEHECYIGPFVHLAPSSTICGESLVGEGTFVGPGAVVARGVHIGRWCILGAGTVVTESIPDYSVVLGVPGKVTETVRPRTGMEEPSTPSLD